MEKQFEKITILSRPQSSPAENGATPTQDHFDQVVLTNPEEQKRSQYVPEVKMLIMKRPSQSSVDKDQDKPKQPLKTLEQRQAEYNEARIRILGNAEPADKTSDQADEVDSANKTVGRSSATGNQKQQNIKNQKSSQSNRQSQSSQKKHSTGGQDKTSTSPAPQATTGGASLPRPAVTGGTQYYNGSGPPLPAQSYPYPPPVQQQYPPHYQAQLGMYPPAPTPPPPHSEVMHHYHTSQPPPQVYTQFQPYVPPNIYQFQQQQQQQQQHQYTSQQQQQYTPQQYYQQQQQQQQQYRMMQQHQPSATSPVANHQPALQAPVFYQQQQAAPAPNSPRFNSNASPSETQMVVLQRSSDKNDKKLGGKEQTTAVDKDDSDEPKTTAAALPTTTTTTTTTTNSTTTTTNLPNKKNSVSITKSNGKSRSKQNGKETALVADRVEAGPACQDSDLKSATETLVIAASAPEVSTNLATTPPPTTKKSRKSKKKQRSAAAATNSVDAPQPTDEEFPSLNFTTATSKSKKSGKSYKRNNRTRSTVTDPLAYTLDNNKEVNGRITRRPRGPDGTKGFTLVR